MPKTYTFREQDGSTFEKELLHQQGLVTLISQKGQLPQIGFGSKPKYEIVSFRCVQIMNRGAVVVEYHETPPCKDNNNKTIICCNLMYKI
jgi:hypothetical protein